ncbi:MAG: hypothetical protein NC082_04815 [Clostridiales bacterium]|nr:hypothetical protein [Clostridiales bacterium]
MNQLKDRCLDKERELLDKYFGSLVDDAAIERPDTIGEYTPELPLSIEAEYRDFLVDLWNRYVSHDKPLVLDDAGLRLSMTEDDREGVDAAYKKARERTLWERITCTNHEDVTYYKGLLKEYTRDLLLANRLDFLGKI